MEDADSATVTVQERCALLTKAWLCYAAGNPITEDAIALEYHTDEDGIRTLVESPTMGGIDLDVSARRATDPDPEEVAAVAEDIRNGNGNNKGKGKGKSKAPITKPVPKGTEGIKAHAKYWGKDDTAWVDWQAVHGDDDPPEFGTLTSDPWDTEDNRLLATIQTPSGEWEVPVAALSVAHPALPSRGKAKGRTKGSPTEAQPADQSAA